MAGRRKVPTDLKAIQDERLTCRHIQALMQLQQVTDENEELKSRLQTLEKEISSCQELHKIARDSEKTLNKLDQEWRVTMEKSLCELRASHKKKMIEFLNNDEKAKISEKKSLDEFQMKIKQLENENKDLKRAEAQNINNKEVIKGLEAKLSESLSQLADAEALAKRLGFELAEVTGSRDLYESEKNANKALIDNLEKKVENMSLKLSSEMEARRKLVEQSDLVKELENQRYVIESYEKERTAYQSNIDELRLELDDNGKRIRDLEKENMIILLERDALQQSSVDLRREVEYLKEKEAMKNSSCSDFHEYVSVKRELNSLKEENMKLKSSTSKSETRALRSAGLRAKPASSKSSSSSRKI